MILLEMLVAISLSLSLLAVIYLVCSVHSQNRKIERMRQVSEMRTDAMMRRIRQLERRATNGKGLVVNGSELSEALDCAVAGGAGMPGRKPVRG